MDRRRDCGADALVRAPATTLAPGSGPGQAPALFLEETFA